MQALYYLAGASQAIGSGPDAPLSDAAAIDAVRRLIPILTERKERVELAYFFGVAFDVLHAAYDRKRFKEGLIHLLEDDGPSNIFLVCIDPNFNKENMRKTFFTLIQEDWTGKKVIPTAPSVQISLAPSPVPFFQIKYGAKTFHIMFLNYGLRNRDFPLLANPIGKKAANQVNIQEGRKTIQDYTSTCSYAPDSFYGALEDLARVPFVSNLTVASSATAHSESSIGYPQPNGTSIEYRASRRILEFGMTRPWVILNRYFEDFCEILTLMKRVSDIPKPVYFLTLETYFPVFEHPLEVVPPVRIMADIARKPKPFTVPFNSRTTFFKNTLLEPKRGGGKTPRRKLKRRQTKKRV